MIPKNRKRNIAIICWLIALAALFIFLTGCAGQLSSSHLNGVYERKMRLVIADDCKGPLGRYRNLGNDEFEICASTRDFRNLEMIMHHEMGHSILDILGLPQPDHRAKWNKYTGKYEKIK